MKSEHRHLDVKRLVCAITLLAASATAAAQIYRWTDEKARTHYSNVAPAKTVGRSVAVVEDRLSVYTPDRDLTDAIRIQRERRRARDSRTGEAEPRVNVTVLAPSPARTYDPCLTGADPNCASYSPYDSSPVFFGRQRVPRLVQPELPPGAIAGQVVGNTGFIAGQSAQHGVTSARPARPPRASFTLKPEDRDSGRRPR